MYYKYVFGTVKESVLEWIHFLYYSLKGGKEYKSNLIEIYKIKRCYINEGFVKEFLEERKKVVAPNRYRIEIVVDETPGEENIIGTVTLLRKKKLIEQATLVTRKNDRESEKLIYWRF